jgi:hypothetical protein
MSEFDGTNTRSSSFSLGVLLPTYCFSAVKPNVKKLNFDKEKVAGNLLCDFVCNACYLLIIGFHVT